LPSLSGNNARNGELLLSRCCWLFCLWSDRCWSHSPLPASVPVFHAPSISIWLMGPPAMNQASHWSFASFPPPPPWGRHCHLISHGRPWIAGAGANRRPAYDTTFHAMILDRSKLTKEPECLDLWHIKIWRKLIKLA
jgi:hypothetical protein